MTMTKKKLSTYQMAVTALVAALLCILSPLSLPIGPVPITLATLIIYLGSYLLGSRLGTLSCLIYLVLGAVGLPVFSGYAGGVAKIVGPTGGYLIGYLPMAFLCGLIIERSGNRLLPSVLGMVLGTAVLYAIGTVWFVVMMKCELLYALTVCVVPFLLGDALKIVLAVLIGKPVRDRLCKAGYLKTVPAAKAEASA